MAIDVTAQPIRPTNGAATRITEAPAPRPRPVRLEGLRLLGCSGTNAQEVIVLALLESQRDAQLALVELVHRQRRVRITIEEIEE